MPPTRTVGYQIVAQDLATKTLKRAKKEVNKFVRSVQREFSKNLKQSFVDFQRVAKIALVGAAVATVSFGAKFEQKMADVQAVTNATNQQFIELRMTAEEVGRTTQFSATQAAEGLELLGRAGFDVKEQIASIQPVLNLAAGAGVDMSTSADIASSSLRAFNLVAEEMTRVVDTQIKTINNSNTNLLTYAESMKFVAPVASTAGISIEETSAAIGRLADFGIKGTISGTALRRTLVEIQTPAKQATDTFKRLALEQAFAADGSLSFIRIIEQLEKAGASAAEIMEIFGVRAGPAIQALLLSGSDALRDFTKNVQEATGAAERAAKIRLDTLFGDFKLFLSKIEGLSIQVFDRALGPLLRTVLQTTNTALDRIISEGSLGKAIAEITDQVLDISESIIIGFGKGIQFIDKHVWPAIKQGVKNLISTFEALPDGVKSLGLLGFLLLGIKGKLAVTAISAASENIEKAINKITANSQLLTLAFSNIDFDKATFEEIQSSLRTVDTRIANIKERISTGGLLPAIENQLKDDLIKLDALSTSLVALREQRKALSDEDFEFKIIEEESGKGAETIVRTIRKFRGELDRLRHGFNVTSKASTDFSKKTISELVKLQDAAKKGSDERILISRELAKKLSAFRKEVEKEDLNQLKRRLDAFEGVAKKKQVIINTIAKKERQAIISLSKLEMSILRKRLSEAEKGSAEREQIEKAMTLRLKELNREYGDNSIAELIRIKNHHNTTAEDIIKINEELQERLGDTDASGFDVFGASFLEQLEPIETELERIATLGIDTAKLIRVGIEDSLFQAFSGQFKSIADSWKTLMSSMLETFQRTAAKIATDQIMRNAVAGNFNIFGGAGTALAAGAGLGAVSLGAQQGGKAGLLTSTIGGAATGAAIGSFAAGPGIAIGAFAGAVGGSLVAAFSSGSDSAQKYSKEINELVTIGFKRQLIPAARGFNQEASKISKLISEQESLKAQREDEVRALEVIQKDTEELSKSLTKTFKSGIKSFSDFETVMSEGFEENTKSVEESFMEVKSLFKQGSRDAFDSIFENEVDAAGKARDKIKQAIDIFNSAIETAKQKVMNLKRTIEEIRSAQAETEKGIDEDIRQITLSGKSVAEKFKLFSEDVDSIKRRIESLDKIPLDKINEEDIKLRKQLTSDLRAALKIQLSAGEELFGSIEDLKTERSNIETHLQSIDKSLNASGLKKTERDKLINDQESSMKRLETIDATIEETRNELRKLGITPKSIEELRSDTIGELEALKEESSSFYDRAINLYEKIASNTFRQINQFSTLNSQISSFLTGFSGFLKSELTGKREDIEKAKELIDKSREQIDRQEKAEKLLTAISNLLSNVDSLPKEIRAQVVRNSEEFNKGVNETVRAIRDEFATGKIEIGDIGGRFGDVLRFLVNRGLFEGVGVSTLDVDQLERIFTFLSDALLKNAIKPKTLDESLNLTPAEIFRKRVNEDSQTRSKFLTAPRQTDQAQPQSQANSQNVVNNFNLTVGDTVFDVESIVSSMSEDQLESFLLKIAKTNQGQVVSAFSAALEKFENRSFIKNGRTV